MRKRTNATKATSSYYGEDVTMDSDDDDDNNKDDIPEGVDFQKYAEDVLMQRLMAKEKEEEEKRRQADSTYNSSSTMTGLSEKELLWVAGALMLLMFMVGTGVIVFLVTKKKY